MLYHRINAKSEKRIWTDVQSPVVNKHLFRILDKETWDIEPVYINDTLGIRFVSGEDWNVSISEKAIDNLLAMSKKYPEVAFYMEDSLDGLVAKWQDGEEL